MTVSLLDLKLPLSEDDEFFTGKGKKWIKFKSNLKKHHSGLDATADIHCKGLKMINDLKTQETAQFKIHKVFIKAALECIQTKASAENFETTIAYYKSLGVNVGNIQHSRKCFPDLLSVICSTIDSRLDSYLAHPIPSTGAPPHLMITFDKSTINRCTNQAVLVMGILNGKRQAWFLDAPLVYSVEKGDTQLSGGQSESLVQQIKSTINKVLSNVTNNSIQGAVADGQYQNTRFITAFNEAFDFNHPIYDFLLWDISHFLDLVAKKFNNQDYMSRIIKRVQHFHNKLGHGKMHQIAQNVGEQRDVKTLNTLSTSKTRFLSSELSSMKRVLQCYEEYIIALYDYAGMRHNTGDEEDYDPDEGLVCGQDFLIDLLGVVDILSPIATLMQEMQHLQCPAWKIIPFGNQVVMKLIKMKEDLEKNGWNISDENWPRLSSNISDVLENKYKSIKLVEGWIVINEKRKVEWRCRQEKDCKKDLLEFLDQLTNELSSRLNKCVPKGIENIYLGCDLSRLVTKQSGDWCDDLDVPLLNSSVEEDARKFIHFYEYATTLAHVVKLEKNPNLVFKQALNAIKLIVWGSSSEFIKLRNLIFKPLGGEDKEMPSIHPDRVSFKEENLKLVATFSFGEVNHRAALDEEELTRLLYCDEKCYSKFGQSFCFIYDLAVSKVGTEAICESIYSVMKTHQISGTMKNETLVNRTKADWHLPKTPLGIEDFIDEATATYSEGRRFPIAASLSTSKVLSRLARDTGKLPPKI